MRVGMTSPVDSFADMSSTDSSSVFVRTSMPRARSSRVVQSASAGSTSGMIRSWASTRMNRVPSRRQRG
jgi:hypothetical protein